MHCRRDGSAMHGTNYGPLDHFHSPTIQSTMPLRKRISIEQSIKSDRYHSALGQPVHLCPRAKLPAYYPVTHAKKGAQTFLPHPMASLWIFHSHSCGFEDRLRYCWTHRLSPANRVIQNSSDDFTTKSIHVLFLTVLLVFDNEVWAEK